jgi:hypothetical protein
MRFLAFAGVCFGILVASDDKLADVKALLIIAVVVIAASVFADYKWRRWMAARREEQDRDRRA